MDIVGYRSDIVLTRGFNPWVGGDPQAWFAQKRGCYTIDIVAKVSYDSHTFFDMCQHGFSAHHAVPHHKEVGSIRDASPASGELFGDVTAMGS